MPYPKNFLFQLIQVIIGILIIGVGSGYYLCSSLGAGPRDGLQLAIARQTNQSLVLIRTILEVSAVLLGFILGGIVGIGTLIYAIAIGYSVSFGLFLMQIIYKKIN